ncbi:hypothetical protein BJF92_11265 [Rhizobium rhizosphaerae]|uniref:Uncharacterized protein n=1 Tax=Xaviernesmea rhizosphaerae TaxID=1672749 RepID=A0A1Q9AMN4_9HYPH|nr:hypothetical protein [Xaviernesmea rhizosphaerae]OLP56660.1 hypothetical protein BJF92_11265 [Xaviernesmea rhizosphaerae]
MDVIFDLFGNPVPLGRGKRGRPEHVPTIENRNRVSMLLALGWSNERIANSLAITLPTLRKHYFSELKQRGAMRDRLEARRLELAWRTAEAGNVGAMKEFGRLVEKSDRMEIERELAQDRKQDAAPEKEARLGKKALEAQRALDADAELTSELEQEAARNARH